MTTQVKAYWGKTIPIVRETQTVPVSLLLKCSLLNTAPASLFAVADLASPGLEHQIQSSGRQSKPPCSNQLLYCRYVCCPVSKSQSSITSCLVDAGLPVQNTRTLSMAAHMQHMQDTTHTLTHTRRLSKADTGQLCRRSGHAVFVLLLVVLLLFVLLLFKLRLSTHFTSLQLPFP